MPSEQDSTRTIHEFARAAREYDGLTIELDEKDLYALQQGSRLTEVVETSGTPLVDHDNDTWAEFLEIRWSSVGTVNGSDIRDERPDIFEGVIDDG